MDGLVQTWAVRHLAGTENRVARLSATSEDVLLERAEAAYRQAVGDPAKGRVVTAEVVADARAAGHIEALVLGLRGQAWCERVMLESTRAKQLLDEAARAAEKHGLNHRLAEVLVGRAAVNEELGRARAAHRDLQRARDLVGEETPPDLDLQSGVILQNAGHLAQAATHYRRVLRKSGSPADIRAKVANNLALIEAQFGRFGVAMALMAQARQLSLQVGPALTAYFTEGEAWITAHAGRLPESLRLFEEAERLFTEADLPRGELYAEYADAMLDLRLLPEARIAAGHAVDQFSGTGVPLMHSEALLRLARVALLSGDAYGANEAAVKAVESFRRQQRTGWAARAAVVGIQARLLGGIVGIDDLRLARQAARTLERLALSAEAVEAHVAAGQVARKTGRTSWALDNFDRAHLLASRQSTLTRLRGRIAAATAASLRDDRRMTLSHCRSGLADLRRHRDSLGSTELRVLASGHGGELGQIALRALSRSSSAVDMFRWMERTRAAALVTVHRDEFDMAAAEFALLRSMEAEIHAQDGGSPALLARQAALEQRLRRLSWESTPSGASTSTLPTMSRLRELLGERWLVEYGVLDGAVLAAVVSATRLSIVDLGPIADIAEETKKLSFLLRGMSHRGLAAGRGTAAGAAQERLRRLNSRLLDPLSVPPGQEVVIVPVDLLQRVPWSALHDGPVSVAPSASFWASARERVPPDHDSVLLTAGPELEAAEREVRELSEVYGDHVALRPPHSTVNRVAEHLDRVGMVHFACHGVVRVDNPMFSGLLLSDGYLTVQELEVRALAPYRVVLAACEAASDTSYPGGEMLGFVSALLARGTAGVLGSIQLVPDTSAVALMVNLHQRLSQGDSLATALYGARAYLDLDDPHDLVNWCGFTAYGAA